MSQTKLQSLKESVVNVLIGYCISVVIGYFIYKSCNVHMPIWKNLFITMLFTVTSIARQYIIRRYFNNK